MELELLLNNDRQCLPSVGAFIHSTFEQLSLPVADTQPVGQMVVGAVQNAVEHAYPDGDEGKIQLTLRAKHGRLEIRIRDYGMPADVAQMERGLHTQETSSQMLFGCPIAGLLDEVHWLNFGRDGKALQILKWLPSSHIAERAESEGIVRAQDKPPLAPQQDYEISRMRSEEAVQVSQLMYRAYGNTYFNPDVYYPERVAAQNAENRLLSFVARAQDNSVVGHYALELNQEGPVAEGGQAVVDPAHRGRGLLDRMRETALTEASRLDLMGYYADAVSVHTRTEQSNISHGGRLTSVDLGISPKTERFRNIAEEQSQRVTCLLYFHWLKQPALRIVHVPERHRPIVTAIYENLGCPIQFGETAAPSGHGMMTVRFDSDAATAYIRADQLGEDTLRSLRHTQRDLVERLHAEAVFVELPIADPGTAYLVPELEKDGLGFAGIAPHFSKHGDILRLVHVAEPLAREPIKTVDEFAARLVDYALAEQARVRDII